MRKGKKKTTPENPASTEKTTGKVGYCHPPVEHQFKPGNRAGRGGYPPSRRFTELLIKALQKQVVDSDGKKRGKWIDVIIASLLTNAAKGNASLIKEIIDRLEGKTPMALEITPDGAATYSERIAALFARLDGQASANDGATEEASPDGSEHSDPPGPDTGKA